MIKKVKQKHKLGCASACLAMVMNISYEKALKKLKPHRKSHQRTSANILELIATLKKNNFNPIVYWYLSDTKPIATVDTMALIVVKTNLLLDYTHVVVWDPKTKRILDPAREKALPLKTYQKSVRFIIKLV